MSNESTTTPANQITPSPTSQTPSMDNQTTPASQTPSTDNETTPASPATPSPTEQVVPSPLFAPSPLTNISVAPGTASKPWSPSPLALSPQLVDDGSVVPMVALLIFALVMGVIFTFRKHIHKITFRRNAYHTIDEGAPEQELTMVGPISTDTDIIDDGKITEEDINNMI